MRILHSGGAVIACLAIISLAAGLWGCGKKGWPEPRLEEDRFQWGQIQHQRYDHCLDVRALLDGAAANLRSVTLEWMVLENATDDPGAAFVPTGRARLGDSSPEFKRQERVIRILFCGLEADASYAWRLVGRNRHAALDAVSSPVQLSP